MNLKDKLDYWRKNGVPGIGWNCEGGTGAFSKKYLTVEQLESKLKDGMKDDEIDGLLDTKQGEATVNKYIDKKYKEGKHISSMTNGLFNRKLPNGDLCKNIEFDHHSGVSTEL